MFVQKVILDYKSDAQNLFLRKSKDKISFDTFFNSLNIYLIKHYTDGANLTIFLDYDGEGTLEIVNEDRNRITSLFKSSKKEKRININLSNLNERSILYPVFYGDFNIKSIRYEVDAPSRKTTTCILFTTYNRQEFLIPNLYKLNTCDNVEKIIIVDNANNLDLPKDLNTKKFEIIPNRNLGGTGGFTRGMIEAKKEGFSHIFIMDDDITLLPEVVDKALSLASCLNDKHQNDWIGFSMFPNGKPNIQFELGSKWNGVRMRLNKHNLDMTDKESLFINQVNEKYNYSAWWSLVMPSKVIEEYSYPLPFFIKFDDIEYGFRRKEEEIILTNGFGVWHEDFDKKYNPYLEYYLYRNALVTNALHDKKPLRHSLRRFAAKNLKVYFRGRFVAMKLMNIAINDYLNGPSFFKSLDIEKKNIEIRNIAKRKVNVFKGIFIYPFIAVHYYFKLLFSFKRLKPQYEKEYKSLTSEEFWNGVFRNDK